jgi:hypothetical protein
VIYRVCGKGRFLGYEPGEEFVAELEFGLESRAIARGSIEIVGQGEVSLDPTQATLPRGWTDTPATSMTKGD